MVTRREAIQVLANEGALKFDTVKLAMLVGISRGVLYARENPNEITGMNTFYDLAEQLLDEEVTK